MTNVVSLVLAKTPSQFVGQGPQFPQKSPDEILKAEMLALKDILSDLLDARSDVRRFSEIEQRAAPLMAAHATAMRTEIEQELRPATVRQINEMIFMLIESRRDSKELSATFAEMAVSRVGSLQPSFGALQAGIKRLIDEPRAEFKAKMEIADILDAIKVEQTFRESSIRLLDIIPAKIADMRKQFDEDQRMRTERRERQKANIRRVLSLPPSDDPLASVPDLSAYDRGLVQEVRQELGLAQ